MTRSKTTSQFKEVSYSYPSSCNAERTGFGKTGCFTVSVERHATGSTAHVYTVVSGHATRDEAFDAADKLPQEYGRFSLLRDQPSVREGALLTLRNRPARTRGTTGLV